MQIKATLGFHFTLVGMVAIRKRERTMTLMCEHAIMKCKRESNPYSASTLEVRTRSFKKLKRELPHHPATPLLGTRLTESNSTKDRDTAHPG